MRVAELLSDLTSLRPGICDSKAALALVSARAQSDSTSQAKDDDLQRVKDLIELHAKVKSVQEGGVDADLRQARESVTALMQK